MEEEQQFLILQEDGTLVSPEALGMDLAQVLALQQQQLQQEAEQQQQQEQLPGTAEAHEPVETWKQASSVAGITALWRIIWSQSGIPPNSLRSLLPQDIPNSPHRKF